MKLIEIKTRYVAKRLNERGENDYVKTREERIEVGATDCEVGATDCEIEEKRNEAD